MNREIKDELKKLTKPDKAIIGKMMSYLYTRSINQFELKNMHTEIVGMAAEGAIRGEKLENICGPDYKKFCDDLSANCLHKSRLEVFLEVVMILSISFAILLPFMYLNDFLINRPEQVSSFIISIKASEFFGISLVPASCGGFGALFYQRNSFARNGKALLLYILFYFVTYFILRVLSGTFLHGDITIDVLYTAIATVGVFVFSLFVKRAVAEARMKAKQ